MNTSISEQVLFWLFLFLGHRGPSHTLMNDEAARNPKTQIHWWLFGASAW
jgi:hypothetical protein